MKFTELDKKMRVFETTHDHCVAPETYIVARIDGRNFSRLTKETHAFEAPFDVVFRDHMIGTVKHLMDCGFRVIFGYTQSDEISLLFHPGENAFGRKTRKFNSVLAGEASAKFSLLLGDMGAFDCRLCLFPNEKLVVDYFRWRNEDASRNALNAHSYWALREKDHSPQSATDHLAGLSTAEKHDMLMLEHGVNFNELPTWQKRGVGVVWEQYEKPATNPLTGEETKASRTRLGVDLELPMKDAYSDFIWQILKQSM